MPALLAAGPPPLLPHFGGAHIAALVATAAAAALMIAWGRGAGGGRCARRAEVALAVLLLTSYPAKILARYAGGIPVNVDVMFPLHLCDLAALAGFFALALRAPLAAELTYFWGLAGTVQAILTPSTCYDFPSPAYFAFFQLHAGVVVAALYLPLGLGWRPRPGAVLRVWVWGLGYVAVAAAVDFAAGANYGFFREPAAGSLMVWLGPWPIYVVAMVAVALPVFALLGLPFARRAGR